MIIVMFELNLWYRNILKLLLFLLKMLKLRWKIENGENCRWEIDFVVVKFGVLINEFFLIINYLSFMSLLIRGEKLGKFVDKYWKFIYYFVWYIILKMNFYFFNCEWRCVVIIFEKVKLLK